jgi:propionaldehyde dehydrogenase
VVESVAERLVQQMQTFGALLLSPADTDKLRAACLPEGQANKNWSAKAHRPCWKRPGSPFRRKRRVC